jgi:tetratricopeptide (TPR) repeat protein
MQGLLKEAINQFGQALSLDASYLEARYNLGMAYMAQQQLDDAIAEFTEALRLNPQFRPAEIGLNHARTLQSIPKNQDPDQP